MLRERKRYPNENHHDHDMRHYFEDEEEGGGTERYVTPEFCRSLSGQV